MGSKVLAYSVSALFMIGAGAAFGDQTSDRLSRLEKKIAHLEKDLQAEKLKAHKPGKDRASTKKVDRLARMMASHVTVSTTPYMGMRNGNVLYQLPSMNEDLRLLQQKRRLEKHLNQIGTSLDERTLVGVSGAIEGNLSSVSDYHGKWEGNTTLSTSELDFGVFAGQWVNGFFSISYDSDSNIYPAPGDAANLYLERGFLTIGNLARSPFYGSLGKMYLPFGSYSSAMLTAPLTKMMSRITANTLLLGYAKGPFFAQAYGFNSLQKDKKGWPVDEGGVNIGYENNESAHDFRIATGLVSNIGDSRTIDSLTLNQSKNVPAFDISTHYTWNRWTFIGEYVTALRAFDSSHLTYHGNRGAHLSAVQAEIDYALKFLGRPATTGIAFSRAWQALGLGIPKQSIGVVFDVHAWDHAAIGVEYRHDLNYKAGQISSVKGVNNVSEGHSSDAITLRVGLYF